MMTPKQRIEVYKFLSSKIGYYEMSTEVQDKVYERYYNVMPYGTAKARTGDPDQWIFDHINDIGYRAATKALEEGKNKQEVDLAYMLAVADEVRTI